MFVLDRCVLNLTVFIVLFEFDYKKHRFLYSDYPAARNAQEWMFLNSYKKCLGNNWKKIGTRNEESHVMDLQSL